MDAKVYNQKGEEIGKIKIPESVFGVSFNADMVHQVVTSMASNARSGSAHTKNRGEVRGGGKKPWRQKGTGQARHGSTRSPIWVGGGVAHGPRSEKNYDRKINSKMKTKALFAILSQKMKDGELFFIDSLKIAEPKTKNAVSTLSSLKKVSGLDGLLNRKKNSAIIALSERDEAIARSFRNIGNVSVLETRNLNPLTLLQYKGIIISDPEASIRSLESRLPVKANGKTPAAASDKKPKAKAKSKSTTK